MLSSVPFDVQPFITSTQENQGSDVPITQGQKAMFVPTHPGLLSGRDSGCLCQQMKLQT